VNVVCVFAHQDDEMRCLGTLQRLAEAGHSISFVCVTNGNKGLAFEQAGSSGQRDNSERAAQVREAEMRTVAGHFGGSYESLGYDDGVLFDGPELRNELIAVLRRLDAELVFTHWTSEYNDDHVVTAKAVTDAALFTNLPSFVPQTPPLASVPRIFYVNPGDGYGFEATHFVALSDLHVQRKAELIRRHASQMDVMRQLRGHDYADEMADEDRRQGARLMVAAAESFRPCLAERRIAWPSDLPGELPDDTVYPA
jgi:LmbE family N-acetylglucosaminyl deacetylase